MKIIDLLNRIAKGEEVPKKIKYNNKIWNYKKGIMEYVSNDTFFALSNFELDELNDTVEILEEKKIPEKLDYIHPDISCSYNESELLLRIEANKDKINSIIDYLKSKGE